jgi:hypothetical protein
VHLSVDTERGRLVGQSLYGEEEEEEEEERELGPFLLTPEPLRWLKHERSHRDATSDTEVGEPPIVALLPSRPVSPLTTTPVLRRSPGSQIAPGSPTSEYSPLEVTTSDAEVAAPDTKPKWLTRPTSHLQSPYSREQRGAFLRAARQDAG